VEQESRQVPFTQVDNRIIIEYGPRIGPAGLAVYLVLSKFADRATRTCYPSITTLAALAGIGRRSAVNTIRGLEQAGLITVQSRRTEKGGATSNEYTLLELPCNAAEASTTQAGTNDATAQSQAQPRPSAPDALPPMQDLHHPHAPRALPPVHDMHPPCAPRAHEQEPVNKSQVNKGTRDANLDRPAVQAYRKECKLTPNETQRAAIAAAVADLARWEEVMRQWLLLGYRKNNVAGMLDWYRHGVPERSRGNHGVSGGCGQGGAGANARYRARARETADERARLDAEWESLAEKSVRGAGGAGRSGGLPAVQGEAVPGV
jgi:hypothetical protein